MVVLQYDPYSQTANLQMESEETGAIFEFKNLSKNQKDALKMLQENIILQNQIENLIKVLKGIDSSQRFRFVGTEKDFKDFSDGLKELAPKGDVEKVDDLYFHDASYIGGQLENICGTVRQKVAVLNEKYPEYSQNLHFDSNGLDAMLNDRTPLVFMGSGSAGKSSVINALVGAEILPTGDGTTTEFVCDIIPDNCYEVSYKKNGAESKINLNGTRDEAEKRMYSAFGVEVDLDTDVQYDWVYAAVDELSKQDGIEELHVRVPFKNLNDVSKQIVIYDTPGPDSKTRENHKKVLNKALGRFKKGVAVFVTRRTEIEKTNLRSFLREYTDNSEQLLDILNVNAGIVIVNGADETNISKIEEGKESRKRHLEQTVDDNSRMEFQYEQDRMIYFSSPYALGTQKGQDSIWRDSKFEELCSPINKKMYDPSCKFYLPLAKTAELPILRKNAIIRNYEAAEKQYLDDRSEENRDELIAHNSGLRAVEYEISFVVNELAICNRCAQAQKQLEGVLDAVKKSTEEISDGIASREASKKDSLEDKYRTIVNKLFDSPDSIMNETIENIDDVMDVEEGRLFADAIRSINDDINKRWREIKRNTQITMQQIIMNNRFVKEIWNRRNDQAKSYCDEKFKDFKDKCTNTVYENTTLANEEKRILESCMKQWTAVPFNVSLVDIDKEKISKSFFIFKWTNKKQCCDAARNSLSNVLGGQLDQVNDAVEGCIRRSCEKTKESFFTNEKIKAVNPELKVLVEEIDRLRVQREEYEKFQKEIGSKLDTVSKLTQRQQKEGLVQYGKH